MSRDVSTEAKRAASLDDGSPALRLPPPLPHTIEALTLPPARAVAPVSIGGPPPLVQ